MLKNVKDIIFLLLLSNEYDTDIFYDNENDITETFIYFSVMEDKPLCIKKNYNLKHQVTDAKN